MKATRFVLLATAMAIVIVAGLGFAPAANAQGPDEFRLTVTLPKGATYTYPMLPNEWLNVKPNGADMVITLKSRTAFNVYDGKGNAVPVVVLTDEKGDLYVSALEAKNAVDTKYVLGAKKEGTLYDVSAEFTAPKADKEITFNLAIGFNAPPAPKPMPTPASAVLNWVSTPIKIAKEEVKVADLVTGDKVFLDYSEDITVTLRVVSNGAFAANGALIKPDAKGIYSTTVTYTKTAHNPVAIDLASKPIEAFAKLETGDKAEVRLVMAVNQKLDTGQNITIPAPATPTPPAKKADPNATASGLSPTGGYDATPNWFENLWNSILTFLGLRPALASSF